MPTFTTEQLKKLVAYAIQGAGNNKMAELSQYMGITVTNGKLYLNTTDGENYLSVSDTCLADDMDVTVSAELFAKLIGKINSDTVDLDVEDDTLVVNGNGKYTLGLIADKDGNPLSFPDNFPEMSESLGEINASDLVLINSAIKASLSSVNGNIYSSYYFGDVVASTDRAMMSILSKKMFDKPYLLSRQFVDLMCIGNTDVAISQFEDMIIAEEQVTEDCLISVCTKVRTDVEEFKIENIFKFAELEATSFCRVKKADLLSLLDRLSLFVSKYDEGVITLHFTKKYLEVSSLKSDGIERVDYAESKKATDKTIKINIERLSTQLKAYSSDTVDLYYGSDMCIKLVDGDVTQVIALVK